MGWPSIKGGWWTDIPRIDGDSVKTELKNHAKSKKGRNPLQISGQTTDQKSVVTGIFKIYSSLTGLPLQDILQTLYQNNMVVDWIDFYEESVKGGWRPDRTLVKIRDAVGEVFGTEVGKKVVERLNFYLKTKP